MTALLEIKDLHVAYGKVEAVRGIALVMQPGQIVTVIGPNGAGKTTLLAAAAGLLPSRGQVIYDGLHVERVEVEERVERGFCLVPETRELFGDMTVADNLLLGAYTRRRNGSGVKQSLQQIYARIINYAIAEKPAQVPIARPRSASGKAAPMSASEQGMSSAAPAPWTARAAIRSVTVWARPHASEAAANSAMPTMNTRRRPNRSPAAPLTSRKAARQSV